MYLFLLELGPVLLVVDQEASGGLRIAHLECVVWFVEDCMWYGKYWRWKEVQRRSPIEIKIKVSASPRRDTWEGAPAPSPSVVTSWMVKAVIDALSMAE
jgi:hypothetical protein